jgi:hypothetical protein
MSLTHYLKKSMISGFYCKVYENCVFLGYCPVSRSINTPQNISLNAHSHWRSLQWVHRLPGLFCAMSLIHSRQHPSAHPTKVCYKLKMRGYRLWCELGRHLKAERHKTRATCICCIAA